MKFDNIDAFLKTADAVPKKGPVAVILAEDEVEIDTTIRHHQQAGFRYIVVFMPGEFALPRDLEMEVTHVHHNTARTDALETAVNAMIRAVPAGTWMYYCYNAEFLFHPFCETRSIGEMLTFHTEERRNAMLTYVIDLYSDDLWEHPDAVSLERAHLDRSGYYALARPDPSTGHPKERQLDFFGGLRWRFEEHVPVARRKIDRISLFKTKPGLKLLEDHTFNDEEYNTYSCQWHHNLTAAICSFRTAKALKLNPGSTYDIQSFKWHNSAPFEWHSRQLLDLGLMEPGQWF
ncbi:glycosyltransferase family 2 protein [uncultured Tateyamaria sp.]|uniref:glycosyltransferase family 2 protein n=1 Tax=Tateyamaria sp. 1078 TaxID=3417464 RepID=UPI00262082CE|nr:glycosyltransferase family 2 protein [uncultured Tateyamaria sp.]